MKKLLIVAIASLMFAGCSTNTGTYAIVGKVSAPIDVSDSADTVNVRMLFSLTGAKVWSAKNSRVKMTYTNIYTNSYIFGMVEDGGAQNFGVEVDPTVDEAEEGVEESAK